MKAGFFIRKGMFLMCSNTGRKISISSLIGLRKCEFALPFFDLNLAYDKDARQEFFQNMKLELGRILLSVDSKDKVIAHMRLFFDQQYPESSFRFHVQYEASRETDWNKFVRFLDFYFVQGYKMLSVDVSYEVPFNLKYADVNISVISGKADYILAAPDGSVTAVKLNSGMPEHSYRPKKRENYVYYSLELLAMYLGLWEQYPTLQVALFHLKHKDDKGGRLEAQFGRGKNYVQWRYQSRESAIELFQEALGIKLENKCAGCSMIEVCQLPAFQACQGQTGPPKSSNEGTKEKYTLTASQELVVHHVDGPMNVIAVPGSGKTFSLVQRMDYLLTEKHVSPERILFVTFTNKAAGEIRDRVVESLKGQKISVPAIFTFNGLGYDILRNYPDIMGGFCRVADKVDRYGLIEACLNAVPQIDGFSYNGITGEYGLLSTMDAAIASIDKHGIEVYRVEYGGRRDVDGIYRLYIAYKDAYRDAGFIAFDDQITMVNQLFAENEEILKHYQTRYTYVMVDEFQDISESQKDLIYSIAAHKNIVVVGDDDQSIYQWRGGTNTYMLNFAQDWPGAKTIIMEDNFRSVDTILAASNALICNNKKRYVKKILAHKNGKNRPIYMSNFFDQDLLKIVSSALKKGYKPGDIAIISRNNKELMNVQKVLSPFVETISPKAFVIEDAVFIRIKDVLSLYYGGMQDNRALFRHLKYCGCNLEEVQIFNSDSIYNSLIAADILLPVACLDVDCFPNYENRKDESFFMNAGYQLIKAFKAIQYAASPDEAITGIFQILFQEDTHPVLEAILSKMDERMLSTVREVYSYLECMERYADTSEVEYPVREEAVNLLTAHKSKGKEYPMVIVYGTELFENTEDGRCLLYVAMTRAKKTLYLTQGLSGRAPLFDEIENYVSVL